jgi:membrane protein DedA with SNARE-associated domain
VGESLATWVSDVIRSFGYAGMAFLMLAENLFPPIPSEVILPLTGFLVGQGDLRFFPALVVATAGSLTGALVLYALGRWGARAHPPLRWGTSREGDRPRPRRRVVR